MSFVDWASALVLLAVTLAGAYGGVQAILRRTVAGDGYTAKGRGAVLLGLLYLAGGAVAGLALALLLRERLS